MGADEAGRRRIAQRGGRYTAPAPAPAGNTDAGRGRFDRGFTLIELLIVIAVVALLVGLLLPALGSARQAARTTLNLSNMRQLGAATQGYMHEHGVLPPFRLGPGQVHESTGRPRARWQWMLGDYVGQPFHPTDQWEYDAFKNNDDLPRYDNKVFMDPMHTEEDFRSDQTGEVQAFRNGSYGYNYIYLGNTRAEGQDGRPANWPVRESHILTPSQTVAIGDSKGSQSLVASKNRREHSYTLDPPRLDTANTNALRPAHSTGHSPADARHGGRATMGYLDGRASLERLEDLGYVVEDRRGWFVTEDAGDNAMWNGRASDPGRTER